MVERLSKNSLNFYNHIINKIGRFKGGQIMNSLSHDERTQLQTRMAILESQINVLKNEASTLKTKNEQLKGCIKKLETTESTV